MSIYFHNGVILFDSGAIAFNADCCCEGEDCPYCDGKAPSQIEVTVAGVGNDACLNCTGFNATHVLDWNGPCKWGQKIVGSTTCDVDTPRNLRIEIILVGLFLIARLDLAPIGGADPIAAYQKTYGSPPNCLNWVDELLTLSSVSGDADACIWTGSTVKITAI